LEIHGFCTSLVTGWEQCLPMIYNVKWDVKAYYDVQVTDCAMHAANWVKQQKKQCYIQTLQQLQQFFN